MAKIIIKKDVCSLFILHSSQKSVSFIGSHKDFWSVFQNETQASEKNDEELLYICSQGHSKTHNDAFS